MAASAYQKTIAKSYARLIEAGRKAIDEVPESILPALREVAPELFYDEGEAVE